MLISFFWTIVGHLFLMNISSSKHLLLSINTTSHKITSSLNSHPVSKTLSMSYSVLMQAFVRVYKLQNCSP